MANHKQQPDNGSDFMAMVAVIGLIVAGVWFSRDQIWAWFLQKVDQNLGVILTIGVILLSAVILFFVLPAVSKLFFYFRRQSMMQKVEIVLSRDDTTEPFEVTKFFDSANGMLLSKFPWMGWFMDHDHLVWEYTTDHGNKGISPGVQRLCCCWRFHGDLPGVFAGCIYVQRSFVRSGGKSGRKTGHLDYKVSHRVVMLPTALEHLPDGE